ncbi:MAG: hypothetical protein KDB53_11250 [Planctomycetes bacterium]|nr:hypothetical protein [Planctomycetota bacterium]
MAQAVLAALAAGGFSVAIRVFLEREARIRPPVAPLYLERLPGRSAVITVTEASLGSWDDETWASSGSCPACADPVTPFDRDCPACGLALGGADSES